MFRFFRMTIALAGWALLSTALAQEKLSLNIPAQPVHQAIRTLAQQSGLQIAARSEDLAGVRSNAVHGTYAPVEALKLLLDGTGLAIDITQGNSVTIRRRNDDAPPRPPAHP